MKQALLGILAIASLVFVGGCGKPPAKHRSVSGDAQGVVIGPDGKPIDATGGIPMAASLAAFQSNVYEPILAQYCSGCHAETFAPKGGGAEEALKKSHIEFLKRTSFNAFAGVDQSLPVTKMDYKTGGHNCWKAEPKDCYTAMSAAINAWLADLEAAGYKPVPIQYPHSTAAVAFSSASPVKVTVDGNQYIAGSIDTATLAAPFTKGTDDVDGAIASYASTPEATAPLGGNNANAAQAITFNMDVKAAGTYYVWARVKTKAAANSRFFVSAGAGANVQLSPGATTTWKWVQVMTNATTPYTLVTTAAGPQPVKVFYRDPGAKVNQVIMTTRKDDFNGELFSNKFLEVKVPLTVPGVDGASIIATVWEKTTDDDKKSLGVKELRIESSVPLKVKNIKPLINGLFYSNHGTYTIVDTVAGGSDPVIKTGGSTASTWLTDLRVDKLSFSFEVLERAP